MRHASLFSGIGGPEVAAAMLGWENVFHCEINGFGRKVLEYWFPDSESYEDITKTDFTKFRGTIDVLTGGFPCQPFSYAGKRGGQSDERYLWPEMLRVINEVRPTWVIGENVAGIATMVESCKVTDMESEATLFEASGGIHRYTAEFAFTIERICSDLESEGYSVQPMLIPACAVGAPHRRDRVFFIAHNNFASDSIHQGSLRNASTNATNATKEGKERISERNEVQWSNEPADARSSMQSPSADTECLRLQYHMVGRGEARMSEKKSRGRERGSSEQIQFVEAASKGESSADSISGQCQSYSQSDRAEGIRSNTISEPGEWSQQTEFNNGFSEFSRIASDSDCDRGGEIHKHIQSEFSDGSKPVGNGGIRNASDISCKGLEGQNKSRSGEGRERMYIWRNLAGCCGADDLRPERRWQTFPTVSAVHRGNDGIPFNVDKLAIPFGKWRTESIKAYGNAIVPQVMYRIFEAIEALENNK